MMIEYTFGSIPNYFTGPAETFDDPNSCPVAPCPPCPLGKYSSGCGGLVSTGQCGDCQKLPDGAVYDQPSYSLPCSWACSSGTTLLNGMCAGLGTYAAVVTVALPLTLAEVTSNINAITTSFATLGGCGVCPAVSAIPENGITCASCQISMTAQVVSASRRLLTAQTNLVVSIVQASSTASSATVAGLTVDNINTNLQANSISPATVVVAAVQSVVNVQTNQATTPGPTTPKPTTPKPTTPKPTTQKTTTQPLKSTTQPPKPTTVPLWTTSQQQPATLQPTQPPPQTTAAPLPPAAPASSPSSSSNGAVIGGAIGGVVAVLVIIGVVVYFAIKTPTQTATAVAANSDRVHRHNTLIYTRARALPGQAFRGERGPSMQGTLTQGASTQRQDLLFAPPGGFARQPAQLPVNSAVNAQRPRFFTAPPSHGPSGWA